MVDTEATVTEVITVTETVTKDAATKEEIKSKETIVDLSNDVVVETTESKTNGDHEEKAADLSGATTNGSNENGHENGHESKEQQENGHDHDQNGESQQNGNGIIEEEVEMAPLVIEQDTEQEPELQFDDKISTASSSRNSSPRCMTRRSQNKNLPTPKSPKFEMEAEQLVAIDLSETRQSTESTFSTKVNVDSDLTREIDLTLPDENSFLNTAKELTVVETIRRMSSRRSIRPNSDYRKSLLRSQAEKAQNDLRQTGVKRKNRSDSPDSAKRYKVESSPSRFMSYIRSKFSAPAAAEIPASTPKLTGFKSVEEPDVTKIDAESTAEKKWCSIM